MKVSDGRENESPSTVEASNKATEKAEADLDKIHHIFESRFDSTLLLQCNFHSQSKREGTGEFSKIVRRKPE
jgi:hypothetical protein